MTDIDILVPAPVSPEMEEALAARFRLHNLWQAKDQASFLADCAPRIRGMARTFPSTVGKEIIDRLPRIEIISSYGVGYDSVDAGYAARKGILVTNTPDVLNEEVADTALGLLLMTVRRLGAAERYLRAGNWSGGDFPLTASLRNHTVGIVGLGRIGLAIARRLEASRIGIAYHNRTPRTDVPFRYFPDIRSLAAAVDTLLLVLPGGAATKNIVDASVLDALGPEGFLINIGRGSAVDENALIAALAEKRIAGAGLDVFMNEPNIDPHVLELDNVVLLPHVGSASTETRRAMGALVVDNLISWFDHGRPLTPVPETPWPRG